MTITIHNVIQGTDEWADARRGIITASNMKLLMTPTLKSANNDKSRSHLYELLAQRISGFVEPAFLSDDMARGHDDEPRMRDVYQRHTGAIVESIGFVTNDKWGLTLGCSPDGFVGEDGMIEGKSRRQKYQVQTILDGIVPAEYMLQIQTGLLVCERSWCDFISYSGGLPMFPLRAYADKAMQDAILETAESAEKWLKEAEERFRKLADGLPPTDRHIEQEMIV